MNAKDYPENDPRHHVARIHRMLEDVLNHCREDASKVSAPKAQALFETTAKVLGGLARAYEHYVTGEEPAMREAQKKSDARRGRGGHFLRRGRRIYAGG